MAQKFNHCPNCESKPRGLGVAFLKIYECKECDQLYCHNCGSPRCPECGSKEKTLAGKVYK